MRRSASRLSMPLLFIFLSEDHEDFTDVLHRLRASLLADRRECHLARFAFEAWGAHLDELVGGESAVDLGDHVLRKALGAKRDHRLELVRSRLERFPLGWSEHSGKLVSKYTP